MAVQWRNDNRPIRESAGFGLGRDDLEAMKVPLPPTEDRWGRLRWWMPPIWAATALLLVLSVIFLSYAFSTQSRTITGIIQQVGELRKQADALNRLVLDLSNRVEAIERAPKVVPTTVIKPEMSVPVLDSSGRRLPSVDSVTGKEVGELKAAVAAQGEKLDAVLEGLKGSRRRR